MRNRVLWLAASFLLIVLMLVASCGPSAPPAEEKPAPSTPKEEKPAPTVPKETQPAPGPEMVKVKAQKTDGSWVEKMVEKPRYGGVFNEFIIDEPLYFDESFSLAHNARCLELTNEELFIGNWAKGPAGTGENSWNAGMMEPLDHISGSLAESWELLPDGTTLVYHIRKGVRWQNKPPTNGREMTADDVAFSLRRQMSTQTAYHRASYAWETHLTAHPDEAITTPDKWTVQVKTKPGFTGRIFEVFGEFLKIVPRDAVEKYGNLGDWRNEIGTGPFMITDYIPGSSLTFKKNPTYWMKDPLHPDNQLPYLDGVKWLFIKDLSTRIAALRTGKIDRLSLGWEDAASLKKTNPDLKFSKYGSGTTMAIYLRCDRPDLPTYDVKVRQALNMAVDFQSIKDKLYGGDAEILTYPIAKTWIDLYRAPEQYGGIIKDMFSYNPDKAKQFLADAGFPKGFKLQVITEAKDVDVLSIVKDNWSKVGIDMDIQVRELGVYTAMGLKKTYDAYMKITDGNLIFKAIYTDPTNTWNYSQVNDPKINEHFKKVSAAYFDMAKAKQMEYEIAPYKAELAIMVQMPAPYTYVFWQPWVKNYLGETQVGYQNVYQEPRWIWIDQTMRK